MPRSRRHRLAQYLIVAGMAATLAACAVAPPRTNDPLQGFNRKVFAFNKVADKAVIRPVAKAYVKVTGPKVRTHIGDFFSNLRAPITMANQVLQGRPWHAFESGWRFVINTTVGLLGFFDPATHLGLPAQPTDFGVTLARWGVPDGPYLVLPFLGPSTLRDVWKLPVDSYFSPLGWYARNNDFRWQAQYAPTAMYFVTVRASLLPYDKLINSAFDPYVFVRDAYRQRRLYDIYYGKPPLSAIQTLQGTSPSEENTQELNKLLQQQREYEKTHGNADKTTPPAAAPATPAQPAGD